MRANKFYNSINSLYCECTCESDGHKIQSIIKNQCIKANYNKIKSLIRKHLPDLYESLALQFPNPWSSQSYRSRNGKYLIITWSMIEFLFVVNTEY